MTEQVRLQKFLAESGVASRRACENIIFEKRVKVNGTTVSEAGTKVSYSDVVTVDGKVVKPENKKYYIALNKPVGFVCSSNDEFSRSTAIDLVKDEISARLFTVGRLDYNTEGLIFLTNDGDFAQKIAHPKRKIEKTYLAEVSGVPLVNSLKRLERGVVIGGEKTAPAKAEIIRVSKKSAIVEITIHEGRNRQVRKMFESIGHRVLNLKRTQIGSIKLGNIPLGRWRHLSKSEINALLSEK